MNGYSALVFRHCATGSKLLLNEHQQSKGWVGSTLAAWTDIPLDPFPFPQKWCVILITPPASRIAIEPGVESKGLAGLIVCHHHDCDPRRLGGDLSTLIISAGVNRSSWSKRTEVTFHLHFVHDDLYCQWSWSPFVLHLSESTSPSKHRNFKL